MTTFRASVCQIELVDPGSVLQQCEQAFRDCRDSDLLVFPEYVSHGDGIEDRVPGSIVRKETASDVVEMWIAAMPPFSALKKLAESHRKAIVFGCLERRGEALASRAYFYDPEADQLSWYDKAHVHWTEPFLTAGERIEPVATRFGDVGILVCYDMAFAEAPRALGLQGATVLIALSAVPRSFDWRYVHCRLAGAAIQNQFYVLGAHLGRSQVWDAGGHSAIFGADGTLLAHVNHARYGNASRVIDQELLNAWRESERIEPFRRPALYGPLTRE